MTKQKHTKTIGCVVERHTAFQYAASARAGRANAYSGGRFKLRWPCSDAEQHHLHTHAAFSDGIGLDRTVGQRPRRCRSAKKMGISCRSTLPDRR